MLLTLTAICVMFQILDFFIIYRAVKIGKHKEHNEVFDWLSSKIGTVPALVTSKVIGLFFIFVMFTHTFMLGLLITVIVYGLILLSNLKALNS